MSFCLKVLCLIVWVLPTISVRALDTIVVFNEIQYNPGQTDSGLEFVELTNQNSTNIDLSNWRLTGGIEYTIPEGTVIPGGGFLVIAENPGILEAAASITGVLGPFVGKLSNGGETIRLRNNNRRVMDLVEYNDRSPWPLAPDGSGASLSKVNRMTSGGRPENWAASLAPGGTPGAENFPSGTSPASPVVFNELASIADPGSFWIELYNNSASAVDLEGTVIANEAGQEYIFPAGSSIGGSDFFVINAATLNLPLASGELIYLYSSGKADVLDSALVRNKGQGKVPDGASQPWYFFTKAEDITQGTANQVTLEDQVVINEIMYNHRPQYQSPGTLGPAQRVSLSEFGATWRFNQSNANLPAGWATVAHSGAGWESGPGPIGIDSSATQPPVAIATQLNDPRTNSPPFLTFYFETEFTLTADRLPKIQRLYLQHMIDDGAVFYINGIEVGRYNLPAGATIDPSTRASGSTEATLIDLPLPTDTLVVGTNRISVEVHNVSFSNSDIVMGLQLEADEETASSTDPEIPYVENDEEWIELFNLSDQPVALAGWELDDAVSFTFPTDSQIAANGYLIIARDAAAFAQKHPGVALVGEFSGSLSNRGENLRLLDPSGNPADHVPYVDGGPWPGAADGEGSSLELRDPRAENSSATAWAASDNSATSEWRDYNFTLTAVDPVFAPPTNGFHELRLGLLGSGEILIDNVSVVEDPATAAVSLIPNGTFNNADGWRLLGNHKDSGVVTEGGDSVLKISAVGGMSYLNNLIEASLKSGGSLHPVVTGKDYEFSFRAKWLSGSPQFRVELYYNRVAKKIILEQPALHGTPGSQNSRFEANFGPTFAELNHSPLSPSPAEPIEVSVLANDPDGISGMTLRYSVNEGTFQSQTMTISSDGRWSATIPGQDANAIIQFYVDGQDTIGERAFAPAAGIDSRALVKIAASPSTIRQAFRIIMLPSEAEAMHVPDDILSNHPWGCSVLYDNQFSTYDCGIRLRGSMWSRRNRSLSGLRIGFPSDQRFRGVHTAVTLRKQDLEEILAKHMIAHAGGMHDAYCDIVQQYGHISDQDGVSRLSMARFGRNYLESLPGGDGEEGSVFKMEGIRIIEVSQQNDPELPKTPFCVNEPGVCVGFVDEFDFADQGDDKEVYRHNLPINFNEDRDDFTGMLRLSKMLSLQGQQLEDAAPLVIDVDQWMRKFAMMNLCGVNDIYTVDNPHNFNSYVRHDGIVEAMPWDWDHAFRLSSSAPLFGEGNVRKLLDRPIFRRLYYGHMLDIIDSTFNPTYLTPWFNHFGTLMDESNAARLNYVSQRRANVLGQIPNQIPFAIVTNGGNPINTAESSIVLEGDGWFDINEIVLNGAENSLEVTWIDADSWEVRVPVLPGSNTITLTALDRQERQVGTDQITITGSGQVEPASIATLVLTEIHYNPLRGAEEFLEFQNISATKTIDLSNVVITAGVDFSFPAGTLLAPGAYILVVEDIVAFESKFGPGHPIAGTFAGGTGLKGSGETITFEAGGDEIRSFAYSDDPPWPASADGQGQSLTLIAPLTNPDPTIATNWRASVAGPSPGTSDATTFSGDPHGDIDSNGRSNLLDYAFGTGVGGQPYDIETATDTQGRTLITFPVNLAADDIIYTIEISTDLATWTEDPAGMRFIAQNFDEGRTSQTYRWETPPPELERVFFVVRATQR